MKKLILVLTLILCIAGAYAQKQVIKLVVDKNSVVKDSTGKTYAYITWQALLHSGKYTLRPEDYTDANTAFILISKASKTALKPIESKYFTTGETFKPFKIEDIYGNKIDKKAWLGKTVVLNFWFINCAPCRKEIPELNNLVAKYASNPNVMFVAIALDKDFDVKEFITKAPFNYTLVGDGRYYTDMYNIHSYPTHVVIDREGKIRFHTSGYSDNVASWIDKTITESETGKPAK